MIKKILAISLLTAASFNAFASAAVMRVINNSSETVVKIVVSPTYRNQYGNTDLLGSKYILPGNSEVIDPGDTSDANNECMLDVLAISENGSKWEKRMDVCNTTTWTLTGAGRKIK